MPANLNDPALAAELAGMTPEARKRAEYLISAANPAEAHTRYLEPLKKFLGNDYTDLEQFYGGMAPTLLSGNLPHGHGLDDQGRLEKNSKYRDVSFWGPLLTLGPLALAAGGALGGSQLAAAIPQGAGLSTAGMTPGLIGSASGPLGAFTPGLIGGSGLSAAAGTGAAGVLAPTVSTGANVAAKGTIGSFMGGNAGMNLVNQGVGAGMNYFANRSNANAQQRAAELEAQAARETLAFLKEQEATRRLEFQQTQAKNEALFREREARLAPYRQLGAGSIGQLMSNPALAASQRR